jgi:hypothetical protein
VVSERVNLRFSERFILEIHRIAVVVIEPTPALVQMIIEYITIMDLERQHVSIEQLTQVPPDI